MYTHDWHVDEASPYSLRSLMVAVDLELAAAAASASCCVVIWLLLMMMMIYQ